MYLRTEFQLRPMEDALTVEQSKEILEEVPGVKGTRWEDRHLVLSFDPTYTNHLRLIDTVKNLGWEVLATGRLVEVVETLDVA